VVEGDLLGAAGLAPERRFQASQESGVPHQRFDRRAPGVAREAEHLAGRAIRADQLAIRPRLDDRLAYALDKEDQLVPLTHELLQAATTCAEPPREGRYDGVEDLPGSRGTCVGHHSLMKR